MEDIPSTKRNKVELWDIPASTGTSRTPEVIEKAYREAIKLHPFYDNAHSIADVYQDGIFRDGRGNVLGVLVKNGLPEYAAKMAADVLRPAAVRTSLRASMYGGEAPLSGIAGYFDYRGSPIEHKYRKTAFTYEHEAEWPDVFPMIDYVSQIYKKVMPESWMKQDAAIPDVVRIHGSPFSTLTINSRFRTAHHTDAGDFDDGFGCLACLEGPFTGLALTFDSFRVNFVMQPGDVLIFNTHHFHSNTEPETTDDDSWQRLTCVFYYRAALGEAAGYAEYRRRLEVALAVSDKAARVPVSLRQIVQKDNGHNCNRPSAVHKLRLTPFALTAVVHRLRHCSGAGEVLHRYLLAEGERAEVALFGEPLYQSSGIPARSEDDVRLLQMTPSLFKAPAMGGFKECDVTLQSASDKKRYLDVDYLAQFVSAELLEMWQTARTRWLGLTQGEWKKMVAREPSRTTFTWNNRSEMNAAFFDLCEVAKQVLLALLGKDTTTAQEEQFFWALFASHLNTTCATALHMPPEAMSLKKLNIKIKDFTFGGTRYFKDMPPEEQKRRVERKARIEAARRGATGGHPVHSRKGGEWLANDEFDYQTEDCPIAYDGIIRVRPEDNADRVARTCEDADGSAAAHVCAGVGTGGKTTRILVMLPPPETCGSFVHASERQRDNCANRERERILRNGAAAKILSSPHVNSSLPPPASLTDKDGNVIHIRYEYSTASLADSDRYDFVVLQHVLCTVADESQLLALLARVARATIGAILVEETDLQDRQFFRLKPGIQTAYESVAADCFRTLHRARYGTATAHVRTKAELEKLLPGCCVRYKLIGSPLNTTLSILPGTATQPTASTNP